MNIITYYLKNENDNSNLYYREISLFSDKVLKKLKNTVDLIIYDFMNFIKENAIEECRTCEEYMIEFLTMTILLYVYGKRAGTLKTAPQKLLSYLSHTRNKNSFIKPEVDKLKGILSTIFLTENEKTNGIVKEMSFKDFVNLLGWMEASGDFKFSLERLVNWYKFLKNKSQKYVSQVTYKANVTAKWFKIESAQSLGKYTSLVDNFLSQSHPKYRFREDIIFCGRKEIEYHLNMVGAEILNRAFRKDFIKTKSKMVLLPSCMRFQSEDNCKARKSSNGYVCIGCTENCKVNKLSKMGSMHNFKVYMIPHESEAFLKGKAEKGEIGVVGIACVLNLLEGGWKAKSLNFIPQCVVLDYCGCKNHWHKEGMQTDINIEHLKRILQIYF